MSAVLANVSTSEEHHYDTVDFLPRWDHQAEEIPPESEPQDPDEIAAVFFSLRDHNKRKKAKKKGSR